MEKANLLAIMIGVTLVLTLINSYGIFSLSSKFGSATAGAVTGRVVAGVAVQQQPAEAGQPSMVQVSADDDPVKGSENAPVTIVEFSDFQCPYCSAAAGVENDVSAALKQRDPDWEAPEPKIIENYIKTGKVKLVFRDFPLGFHQYAEKAAEAAECADEQGKFWAYHDKLFENQNALDTASLKQYAKELGLDAAKFSDCLDSGGMASEVRKDLSDGSGYCVSGTPSFFVNGIGIEGAQPYSVFEQVIEQELSK